MYEKETKKEEERNNPTLEWSKRSLLYSNGLCLSTSFEDKHFMLFMLQSFSYFPPKKGWFTFFRLVFLEVINYFTVLDGLWDIWWLNCFIWQMTTSISIEDVRREVKILKALSGHKHLVKFYDACEDVNNVYVVMEYVFLGTYSELILCVHW